VNAQVTIGSNADPHSAAVLDLQSTTQGLKLPVVALDNDLTVFKLPLSGTSTEATAKGMFVYNTNATVGEGIYFWDGGEWLLVKASVGINPVTSIRITAPNGVRSVERGQDLQLSAIIEPVDADNTQLVWSIDRGTGEADVDNGGLVHGNAPGTFWVRATASNGIASTLRMAVLPLDRPLATSQQVGNGYYNTVNFNGDIWMVDNSKEGIADYISTPLDTTAIPVGTHYYLPATASSSSQSITPCPTPWHWPSAAEVTALYNYLSNSLMGQTLEALYWDNEASTLSRYLVGTGITNHLVGVGYFTGVNSMLESGTYGLRDRKGAHNTQVAQTVRCVKNK
jgi:hypothetical protein